MDPEVVSQPLWDVGAEDGVRGTGEGVSRVSSSPISAVTSDTATGRPQLEQKRLPRGSGA